MKEDNRYDVVKPTRKIPKAILISKTGMVFNVGDTVVFSGYDDKGKMVIKEAIIGMFSFDCLGELYFHMMDSLQHRNIVGILENAVNKTQEAFDNAQKVNQAQ